MSVRAHCILHLFPAKSHQHMYTCGLFPTLYVDFQVSLDLQWDYCSGLLTLICSHSNAGTNPLWIYNGTAAGGVPLDNIPGAEYTVATSTRHVAVIRGIENVMALDSFTFQCVYHQLNAVVKSNKEQYYWGEFLWVTLCRVSLPTHAGLPIMVERCHMPHLNQCWMITCHS